MKNHHPPITNPLIMNSIDPNIALMSVENAIGDGTVTSTTNNLESLDISRELLDCYPDSPSLLLLDENETIKVSSEEEFFKRLKIPDENLKVKVVSIFGNTGEGKSHTLNQTFFDGEEIFRTSAEQTSCTLGVWAAFDPNLNVICIDTEGLLGVTKKENQRTRLLLKVLAISDIVIFRTRAERLQRDMYTFLGGASKAYKDHFQHAIQQIIDKAEVEATPKSLGPSIIIFHETRHTNTLQSIHSVEESPEDIIRKRFAELKLDCDAFSSLKYVGVQTKNSPTSFSELKNALQLELENTKVRSKRNPKVIYLTLKGLNSKFSSQITSTPPQLYLKEYFTCQVKCQSCEEGCSLSMGHKDENEPHKSNSQCKFQHQYQNCVYLCRNCHKNGQRVIVKPSYQSITEKSWTSLLSYVWSGYIIECRNCGVIYRSREHWYGNKDPEEGAVIAEIVHIWPGDKSFFNSQNSAQRVIDGVSMISDAVASVGAQPAKAVASWVTEKFRPSYWRPDHEITVCHKCKIPFAPTANKHHCRACGEGFCESCSSRSQPVPARGWYEDVRVCDSCYQVVPPSLSQSQDDVEIRARKYGEVVVNSFSAVASVLEIPKGLIKDTARPAYWTPDNECRNCECCGNPFGPLFPLHHCRECGKGVCDDCSTSRKPVPLRGWDNPVRVCDNCLK